jgi:D-alanyl-lipoteichoic acid acyltransferase DltB (MBOAT superfamily)
MLFNSYVFIFAFLPIVLLGFHLSSKYLSQTKVLLWLVVSSLFFYGWWNISYLVLITFSIGFNYIISYYLRSNKAKAALILGIFVNIAMLGYYKYANFFIENLNYISNSHYAIENIILPLAISFFTFQQITYLIDSYKGITKDHDFIHYCLFVTFFPQLIAGPIVHHKEMLPQFLKKENMGLKVNNVSIGLTIFLIGLFKKVVIADSMGALATPIFNLAEQGVEITILEAWGAALAYSLQLYFDFSGYSDMAIGLARMFNIKLPVNFFSPYKSKNIIEFWRRWHITLSNFLKDYIYIPLGGSRNGKIKQLSNLLITMLIGGLWHGAGWTFIIWGGMHGLFLIINHLWLNWKGRVVPSQYLDKTITKLIAWLITILALILSWVIFRAETLNGAMTMYSAMFGFNGLSLPNSISALAPILLSIFPDANIMTNGVGIFSEGSNDAKIIIACIIVLYFPNTLEWMYITKPALNMEYFFKKKYNYKLSYWEQSAKHARLMAMMAVIVILSLGDASEFLYFQF